LLKILSSPDRIAAIVHPERVRSGWFSHPAWRNISKAVNRRFRQRRELQMLAALSIGFMLAIWVVVIWGAAYFNQNVN
jgi:hypothetical protein